MNEIMVSVICTAYNHEKYIRSALDGFVMQKTNFKFEVLVHDDASTDGTADIIKEYAEKYSDIIKPIFEKENQYSQGVNFVRTIMFPLVKGKYMAFCEGDDYWIDPLKLQKQVDFLEEHPDYSMCGCLFEEFDESKNLFLEKKHDLNDVDFNVNDVILEKTWGKLHLAGVLICFDVEQIFPKWRKECSVGDYPMFINASLHGKIRILRNVMSVYRRNTVGSWTERCSKNLEYSVNQHEMIIKSLRLLDQDTGGQYTKAIQQQIIKKKILIAIWRQEALFFVKNFFEIENLSSKEKIDYILQFSCPSLYKCLRSVYHLFKKLNQ